LAEQQTDKERKKQSNDLAGPLLQRCQFGWLIGWFAVTPT
jgi:hypothetical protein